MLYCHECPHDKRPEVEETVISALEMYLRNNDGRQLHVDVVGQRGDAFINQIHLQQMSIP